MGRGRLHTARAGQPAPVPRSVDERAVAHAHPEILPRAFGPDLERDSYLLTGEIQPELTHEACEDLDTAKRFLRRAILMPEAVDGLPHEEGPLEVTIPVTARLLAEVHSALRSSGAPLVESPALIVLPDLYGSEGHCELRVAVRALGEVGGRLISAQAVADLGRTFSGSHLELVESARSHLADRGQHSVSLTPATTRDQDQIPSVGPIMAMPASGQIPRLQFRDQLAGFSGPCGHEQTRWIPNETDDALLLSCEDCLRQRLACIPYHRLPRDHPKQIQLESPTENERYLIRERVYRRALGLPEARSLEQIRRDDGEASLVASSHLRPSR